MRQESANQSNQESKVMSLKPFDSRPQRGCWAPGRKSAGKTGSTLGWECLFSCSSMVPQDAKLFKAEEVVINYKPPQAVIINFSGPRK